MPGGMNRHMPNRFFHRLMADISGGSAIEYGLLVALIGVSLVAFVKLTGTSVTELIDLGNTVDTTSP